MKSICPDIAKIRELEGSLRSPEIRGSRVALEALFAEGFVEFDASGAVYGRATVIELPLRDV